MDRTDLILNILITLADAGEEGLPRGLLFTKLIGKLPLTEYQDLIGQLVQCDLIEDDKNEDVTRITYGGLVQAKILANRKLNKKGDMTMAKADKAATTETKAEEKTPAPTEKKVVKFGPKKRAKLLAKALKRFPEQFMLKDKKHKDTIFSISSDRSWVSKKDGEIHLYVFPQGTDPTDMEKDGTYKNDPTVKTTPKGLKLIMRRIPKEKREGNIPRMIRLLKEGKTLEQIVTEFHELYVATAKATGKEHKQKEEWIKGRVMIYANIAAKQDKEAEEAFAKLLKKAKKERIAAKKAKKAAEAEKSDAEPEEKTEAKPTKKKGGKKKAEA